MRGSTRAEAVEVPCQAAARPVDQWADFSLGSPWDNSATDTLKQLWSAAGVVRQGSLTAAGTALLVATTYYHSQPNIDVPTLFLDKKNPVLFIGEIWLVVYTHFMKKTSMLIAAIVIDKILPQELTETAS